ncbi:MAG: dihydrolipoyl dehydrogenase [Candidatus Hodarchaeota archaeon]
MKTVEYLRVMKAQNTYDIALIGAGPGGYVTAIRAAQMGATVLVIEKEKLGGTCVNWGCIPTKAFLADLKPFYKIKNSPLYEGREQLFPNLDKMVLRKNQVVETMTKGIEALFRSHGVQLVHGTGYFADSKTIGVIRNDRKEIYGASNIIIATGSKAATLANVNIDGKHILSNEEILNLEEIPRNIIIIGGGVIGVEFATIFNALGSKVTIVEMLPAIIPGGDDEVTFLLNALLQKQGMTILTNTEVTGISTTMGKVDVKVQDESRKEQQFTTEKVLMAIGRSPYTEGLGIERIGLKMDGPFIGVNARMETNVDGVYAIGDVIGKMMLAHAASAEGIVAVDNIMGKTREMDYRKIPSCVYTIPEMAWIGLYEKEALEKGLDIRVGKFPYQCNSKAVAMGESNGFVKIIADKESGEIFGVHILGEEATDLIGECVLAMHLGATVKNLAEVVKGHPTLSETVMEAALDWSNMSIHLPRKS